MVSRQILVKSFYQHHQHSWPWPWGRGHSLRILKMLKFSFKFLRPHYFLTLSLIYLAWYKFCAVQSPQPPNTHTPRSCQNQGHGLRFFQKQNVQYQASSPVWRKVLFMVKFYKLCHMLQIFFVYHFFKNSNMIVVGLSPVSPMLCNMRHKLIFRLIKTRLIAYF